MTIKKPFLGFEYEFDLACALAWGSSCGVDPVASEYDGLPFV